MCLSTVEAGELFIKDRSYIVQGGEVVIVDEFTGRVMPGGAGDDGLHQAQIEAKKKASIFKTKANPGDCYLSSTSSCSIQSYPGMTRYG